MEIHSQPGKHRRRRFARSAVCAVNDHAQSSQRFFDRAAKKVLIIGDPVMSVRNRSHRFPRRPGQCFHTAGHDLFQFIFDRVREFVARPAEEFDAVVGIGVVGSGNNHSRRGIGTARQPGDARSRNHAENRGIASSRTDSGAQRRFEHLSRNPGVTANQKCWFLLFPAKIPGCGPAQSKCQFRRQFGIGDPPDSIRAE